MPGWIELCIHFERQRAGEIRVTIQLAKRYVFKSSNQLIKYREFGVELYDLREVVRSAM